MNQLVNGLKRRLALLAVLPLGALVLAACGGDEATTTTEAPVSAVEDGTSADPMTFPGVVPLEQPLKGPPEVPEELKAIWEAWELLRRDHVDRSQAGPRRYDRGGH